jgi:hypothetical protein
MEGVVIDGIEVFGPPGCGLPVVGAASNGEAPAARAAAPPPEFAPSPPAQPPPIAPLQPHPAYPTYYPPPNLGGPTETGPRKVPVDLDPSYYIVKSSGNGTTPAGDMLQNEFATNGTWGVVDWAQRADSAASVPWDGVLGKPDRFGTYWFVGEGPPPDSIPGALPGDLYLDSISGNIYQLS